MEDEFRPFSLNSMEHRASICAATRNHWPNARTGDLDAAELLWSAYDDDRRAWLTAICVRRALDGRLSRKVARFMLTTTWERDSTGLGYYLDYFELLAGLRLLAPGKPRANRPLKVYRGIAEAAEPQEAVAGLSWTSSARVAAFFALRYSASHAAGIACVFEAEVPAKLVLGRFNGRREQEVLVHPDFFVDAETNGALRVEGRSVPITSWGDFAVSSTELARWQRLADRYRQGMQWHIHAPTHK